jgi:hypothetical protein
MRDADHCKVSDNYCYGNTNEGIFAWGDCHFCQYTNNYLYDNGGYGMLLQSSGTAHNYVQILGNYAYHNDDSGIAILEVNYSLIANNYCIDNDFDDDGSAMAGIYIGAGTTGCTYNTIENNMCINTDGTKYQDYGINNASASNIGNIIRNNSINKHPTLKINDSYFLTGNTAGLQTDIDDYELKIVVNDATVVANDGKIVTN